MSAKSLLREQRLYLEPAPLHFEWMIKNSYARLGDPNPAVPLNRFHAQDLHVRLRNEIWRRMDEGSQVHHLNCTWTECHVMCLVGWRERQAFTYNDRKGQK